MIKKIKLIFVIANLSGGGSEKMITNLCNNLSRDKFDITLCLLAAKGVYLSQIKEDVEIIDLKVKSGRGVLINSLICFYKIGGVIRKKRPDVVMSTLTHLNLFMSLFALCKYKSAYYIARESNILSLITLNDPLYQRALYRKLYKYFDQIIAQSDDMKSDLVENYFIVENKISVINNFIDDDMIDQRVVENIPVFLPKDNINLLAIGRLEYQKGYDLLLNTFSKITNSGKLHLTILGTGSEENHLRQQIISLNLEDRVTLLGFCDNPYAYMDNADIFVSSSRFEGFPNVVIESLACGLPVIANNYKGGINEILSEPLFGEIIDITDSVIFEAAIRRYLEQDKQLIKQRAREKYSKKVIINAYDKVFSDI